MIGEEGVKALTRCSYVRVATTGSITVIQLSYRENQSELAVPDLASLVDNLCAVGAQLLSNAFQYEPVGGSLKFVRELVFRKASKC